jgi:NAD(P)-dependent dehydrogenase (short-subunit alcohol dehydrogenase family)
MESTKFDLSGKTVIVTGAGRGIGRACALALAANGASVVLAARTSEQLEQVLNEIKQGGGDGLAVTADVTRKEDAESMAERAINAFGSIDILVNNARVFMMKPLVPLESWSPPLAQLVPDFDAGFTDEDWYRLLETNVTGVYRCCQAVAPHMIAQKKGRIISIASIDSEHGLTFSAP